MESQSVHGKARGRRGRRIARRLTLMLHWREPQGQWREIPAETLLLSRHGCRVTCAARIKKHDEVMVWWLEKNRYAQARVVFEVVGASNDGVEMALEFLGSDDFWGEDFTQDGLTRKPAQPACCCERRGPMLDVPNLPGGLPRGICEIPHPRKTS